MANWCLNTVRFEADETVIEKLRLFFIEMAEKEILKNQGQLPEFYHSDTGYLFEIDWQDQGLTYLTKWAPNPGVLVAVAKTYAADFVYEYEERNMCIYGVTIYRNGILKDVQLELRDFGLFEYDEETDCYYFEDGVYSNEAEILAILFAA